MSARLPLGLCTRVIGLLLLIVAAAARALAASPQTEFPYIAYVAEPDSVARSGPGRNHYPTGQLPVGYAVEVYRHDGNGWCAIRPPEDSFSLAPVQQLRIVDQRTAQVAVGGVAARVGSVIGDERSAVQVLLEQDETVALIEPPSPTSPWVRIAPPPGEFRWIAARRLSRVPPTELRPLAPADDGGWQSTPAAHVGSPSGVGRIGVPEPSDAEGSSAGDPFAHLRVESPQTPTSAPTAGYAAVNPLWQPAPLAENESTGAAPVVTAAANGDDIELIAGSPAAVRQAQYQQQAASPPGDPAAPTAPPLTPVDAAPVSAGQPRIRFEGLSAPSGPLDPRVAEMQLRLSQVVIAAPAAWQFGGLREETAALLAQEQSPECREQLRDLLDRIATFESIQARYRTMPGLVQVATSDAATAAAGSATIAASAGGSPTSQSSELLARVQSDLGRDNGVTPTPGGPTPAATATEALYDAVGTLKPVVSRRPNAPQFALIDDHGDVVTFVTASPDVNLQAFLGQRIGVRGSRGFMPEYRRAHVTASRVTALEQKLVK
jgi:hypothetical protein